MSKYKARLLSVPAAIALVGGAALLTAPTASAHDHPTPVANVGAAIKYDTDHLQYEHLDQPLLGFGPTLKDPWAWTTGHLTPFVLDTAALAVTGHDAKGGDGSHQH
ncbi:hypothetical protein ACWF0M_05440 [Kribbella sp. NPDC055110]